MANSGFSAAMSYFGTISGLTPKESSDGKSASVATATDEFGDNIANDVYGDYKHPSTTYALSADVSSGLPSLGDIVGSNIMVTSIQITTQAGQPPTVTISGEEVESGITAKRTYAVSASILARCKAQDVAGAFSGVSGTGYALTSCTTTFSVDFVSQSVGGEIVAACPTNGRVEVQATVTAANGTPTIMAATGFTITSPTSTSSADEGYTTVTATATKWLTGTEVSSGD